MMVFPATAAPHENIAMRFFCQQNFNCRKSPARPDMSLLPHQNPKRTLVEAEFHRAIAHQFAVDFDRHDLIAFDADLAGLEIFNLRHTNVGTKYYILQIFDDLDITELLAYNDIQ